MAKKKFQTAYDREPRRFEPVDGRRFTEDGVPCLKERVERLLRAGARLEVHRVLNDVVQQENESDVAFLERRDRALAHTVSPAYMPPLDEIQRIMERGRKAKERLNARKEEADAEAARLEESTTMAAADPKDEEGRSEGSGSE